MVPLHEALPAPVAVLDATGVVLSANSPFRSLAGRGGEPVGRAFAEMDGLADVWAAVAAAPKAAERSNQACIILDRAEMVASRAGLPVTPLEVSASYIIDHDVGCYVVTLRDISKRKSIEAELIAARHTAEQANAAKSDLVAMVAHELRTAANGISGLLQLIEQEPVRERRFNYLKAAQRCSGSLLAIVNDILDLTKLEAGKFTVEPRRFELDDLLATIDAFWRPQVEDKGLRFTIDQAGCHAGPVEGDDLRLCQILHNYISNALKHTTCGEIRLTVADPRPGMRRFSVGDTGCGIPDDEREKLFRPFEQCSGEITTRIKGTGLGLAITRRLAEAMQGHAGVSSTLGAGSTFWVEVALPDATTSTMSQSADPSIAAREPVRARLLIAEDDAVNRLLLKAQLEPRGYETHFAADGETAVAIAGSEPFDAIVLDMLLGNVSGDEVARTIRRRASDPLATPIIGFTAFSRNELRADVVQTFDLWLEKGLDTETLVRSLDAAVACGRSRSTTSEQLVDHTRLAGLPADHRASLLQLFAHELENTTASLDACSPAALVDRCHALAGMSANFGATVVVRLARLLHGQASNPELRPLVSRYLADAVRRTISELHRVVSELSQAQRTGT